MFYADLNDRTVFAISGEDTIPFLQGLITQDATRLSQGESLYAALLSPQGKFLHDFFLIPTDGHILLDVNKGRADDLLARLRIYKLRSKVNIEPQPTTKVRALWGEGKPPEGTITITDPRLATLGFRAYGNHGNEGIQAGDYEEHRILLGVPDGAKDMLIDKSFLLEFGFEALHGVNFSKGCYVGQEVTARSKFRGQVRKQLYIVYSDKPLPATGTQVTSGETLLGELRSVSGNHALALLRWEELEKLSAPMMAGGIPIQHRVPEWASMPA